SLVAVLILVMLRYLECQVKVKKEIDSVVGQSRLPDFEDRRHLPLVECMVQETLRLVLTILQTRECFQSRTYTACANSVSFGRQEGRKFPSTSPFSG
ncbi:hypothetical protein C8R45DRAFT_826103, partial [Mycena sanguinolenta]